MYKRYYISFKYADSYSNWNWRYQHCELEAKSREDAYKKCKELYGLGVDCEYEILSIDEIE